MTDIDIQKISEATLIAFLSLKTPEGKRVQFNLPLEIATQLGSELVKSLANFGYEIKGKR